MNHSHLFIKSILIWCATVALCSGSEKPLVWPSPPDPARYTFEGSIAMASDLKIEKSWLLKIWDLIAGNEPVVLRAPMGLHVTNGKIYVADMGLQSIVIFDPIKQQIDVWKGGDEYPFESPIDVDVDGDGNVYISDSVAKSVTVLNGKGKFVRRIGAGILERPTGIAIDHHNGRLMVADTLKCTIEVFDLKGTHHKTIGRPGTGEGEFNRPTFITLDSKGELYVSDSMNQRIQIFSREGVWLRMFGKLGGNAGTFASPRGVGVDRDGNVYVTDSLLHAVQIFNPEGELLLVIGHYGVQNGEFSSPKDIVIDAEGNVYIADFYNMRLQKLKKLSYPEMKDMP